MKWKKCCGSLHLSKKKNVVGKERCRRTPSFRVKVMCCIAGQKAPPYLVRLRGLQAGYGFPQKPVSSQWKSQDFFQEYLSDSDQLFCWTQFQCIQLLVIARRNRHKNRGLLVDVEHTTAKKKPLLRLRQGPHRTNFHAKWLANNWIYPLRRSSRKFYTTFISCLPLCDNFYCNLQCLRVLEQNLQKLNRRMTCAVFVWMSTITITYVSLNYLLEMTPDSDPRGRFPQTRGLKGQLKTKQQWKNTVENQKSNVIWRISYKNESFSWYSAYRTIYQLGKQLKQSWRPVEKHPGAIWWKKPTTIA